MTSVRTGILSCLTVIFTLAVLVGCGATKGQEGEKPTNPFSIPQLNETKEATMIRYDGNNYANSCLFLNASFRDHNTCSIHAQSDLSIYGVQVTDQKAEFIRLPQASSIASYVLENGQSVGDKIEASHVVVGSVWYFRKSNKEVKYELVFEILKVERDQITVRYAIKNFQHLW